MWDRDSPLKQIPHFDDSVVEACRKNDVKDIMQFMDAMDPEENPNHEKLLKSMGLTNKQLGDAARFTNERYPNVELEFELEDPDNVASGSPSYVTVAIERQLEEDEEPNLAVHAPFYPAEKTENWWLVIGEEKSKALLAIKRVTIGRSLKTRLEMVVPTPGKHELTLFLMSDSYIGVDQAPTFEVDAAEGMDEDEEEDDDE
jgi:pre-mRNA-splicing helicase BRR2